MFPPDQTKEFDLSDPSPKLPSQDTSGNTGDPSYSGRFQEAAEVDRSAWTLGSVISDRYILERHLGGGAMGDVFLARDRLLKKPIALKVLHENLAQNRTTVRRFLREVALAHSVTHPNVVRIYDTGEAGGLPFLSMEYLQGKTLEELIGDGDPHGDGDPPMTMREIRELSYEILSGLEAAHSAGVVHRDLKPANVILTHRGAIVMDFGVAGFEAPTPLEPKPNPADARSLIRTEAGTIFGSPAYMAPELWEGAPASVRSDLYSFGVMLYQMLTGKLPIDAPDARSYLHKLQTTRPVPVRNQRRDIPWNLALVCSRCMEMDPEQRPSSAAAAASLIAPLSSRWRKIGLGAAAVAAGAGAISYMLWQRPRLTQTLGLPDPVSLTDLRAIVRSYDVGDYHSAQRQLERLAQHAPHSAGVAFWRALIDHDRGDEAARKEHCRQSRSESEVSPWLGSEDWQELAREACGPEFALASTIRDGLSDPRSKVGASFLPLAIRYSLIPRLESAHEPGEGLKKERDETRTRITAHDHQAHSNLNIEIPMRWRVSQIDLDVASGSLDNALREMESLIVDHPEAPLVQHTASWLYHHLGRQDRARMWAERVATYDPRMKLRLQMEDGQMKASGEQIDALADHPLHRSMVDLWCGYAFRFEVEQLPERCEEMSVGLAYSLWHNGVFPEEESTLTQLERGISSRQQHLNIGDCLSSRENSLVLTHASPPFETYARQLAVTAATCPTNPAHVDPHKAKRYADSLLTSSPDDPWSMLLQAQVDELVGATFQAKNKRRAVAKRWEEADEDLPLVKRLRPLGLSKKP